MSSDTETTRDVVRKYHEAWTSNDHDTFRSLLSDDVEFVFPMEVKWPAGTTVRLVSEVVDENEAVQIYDATSSKGRTVRVAEHLTVRKGKVARIAPIFDLEAMRSFMAP